MVVRYISILIACLLIQSNGVGCSLYYASKLRIESIISVASKQQLFCLVPPSQPCQRLLQLNVEFGHLGLRGGGDKDFKPVIFTKKQPKPAAPPKSRADDDAIPLATVPHELKMAIMKARQVHFPEKSHLDKSSRTIQERPTYLFL